MRADCRVVFVVLPIALFAAGCYSSHVRPTDAGLEADAPSCDPASRPRCATRSGPCDPLTLVDAECAPVSGSGVAWQCPSGAAPYQRPWTDDATCLPLRGTPLLADGVHESPVPVPIGDTCQWIFPFDTGAGAQLLGVASASSCAALGTPTMPIDDAHGAETYVNVQTAFATPNGTRILSRAWAFDSTSAYGVRALGVELGRVIGGRLRFDGAFVFADAADLGDAAIVDGGFVYAFGCPGTPRGLEGDCNVGRAAILSIDDASAWSTLGSHGWGVGDPVRVFGSGPHRSGVLRDPRGDGFLHVYAAGFGSELRMNGASHLEGPWSDSVMLARCELPADDPGAYCAGPQVHRELLDPMDPHTLIVSYSIGSTSADQSDRRARNPDAYWPRIVHVRLP